MGNRVSFLSKLSSYSFWYLIGGIMNNGLAIILLPFLSNMLTPAEYGLIQTANSIGLCLPIIFSFYIEAAFARFYHEIKQDCNLVANLFSTCFWFVVLSGIIVLTLLTFSSPFWFEKVFDVGPYPYVWLITYPYLFYQISVLGSSYLSQALYVKTRTSIDFFASLLNLTLSIYLVCIWENGALARLSGIALAFFAKACFYIVFYGRLKILRLYIDFFLIKKLLRYSVPLTPSAISLWLSKMADRIIISIYVGVAATGIFSVANQIAFIAYFLQDAVLQALSPMQMDEMIRNKEKAINQTIHLSGTMWIFMLGVVLFFGLFSELLMSVFINKSFMTSSLLIMVLSSVYLIQAQYRIFSGILLYHKKTKEYSYAAIAQGIVSVGLNILFIPIAGYVMAAYTSLISVLVFWAMIMFYISRLEKIVYDYIFYIKYLIAFLILIGINLYVEQMGITLVYMLLFKLLILLVFILFSWNGLRKSLKYLKV
ncbi:lipopolysaccharide biosynthesis protein [Odoribacter splanchnicus]|uniref:lipopolysaccharide biosynthesis protein n=1 Tax=Odoribacter splanchnicus TaxID=28118 RepID=UPI0027952BC9|nr:oligosaccharide flippase family protein [Odoribacter splanchnicus]